MTTREEGFPGVSLRSGDFREGRVLFAEWDPNARYRWDAGVAIGRYLAELRQGRLTGTHCRHCHRTVVPPRTVCEWCFEPMSEWVRLQDTGTVNTFSLCYVTWDMRRLTEPEISAVIEIDGTSPPVGIMHLLDEVDPLDVRIGMRVRAVWKPTEERQGAITDIRYFRPL
jgi:uncharacterized OB-fold protein